MRPDVAAPQGAKRKDVANSLSADHNSILQDTKDGTLTRNVSMTVVQSGRGRLRGDTDDDHLVVGTNKVRCVVHRIIDGPTPAADTNRFERDELSCNDADIYVRVCA